MPLAEVSEAYNTSNGLSAPWLIESALRNFRSRSRAQIPAAAHCRRRWPRPGPAEHEVLRALRGHDMEVVRERPRDAVVIDARYLSDLELLILDHAAHRGALQHAVLEGRVVFQRGHRQLAAHT